MPLAGKKREGPMGGCWWQTENELIVRCLCQGWQSSQEDQAAPHTRRGPQLPRPQPILH